MKVNDIVRVINPKSQFKGKFGPIVNIGAYGRYNIFVYFDTPELVCKIVRFESSELEVVKED